MTISKRKKGLALAAALSVALLAAGCGNLSHDVAPDGSGAKELVWPKPAATNAIHRGGTFPNVGNLRAVQSGLNKHQVMALIGEPHFGEGLGNVREWNYLFNFRGADGQVTQCEYKVLFDSGAIARSFYWHPASCADVLKAPAAVAVPARVAAHAVPKAWKVTLSGDALFAFNTGEVADIKPAGRTELDALAKKLSAPEQQDDAVHVIGYTDRLGNASYNRKLSALRAASVRDYLVAQGVAKDRITIEGRGATDPLVTCNERSRAALVACLAPNRRVVVEVRRAK